MAKKKDFWDEQYAKGSKATHLALSDEPAEDLEKFCRYLERQSGKKFLNVTTQAVDIGCGNGRNLIYLSKGFGMRGLGYDSSREAIAQAQQSLENVLMFHNIKTSGIRFEVRDLADPIPLPDSSVTIALDMMASHVLKRAEREALRAEILRVLRPGGWLFFKSFILEEDLNAQRLLREHPAKEEGMYIHPEIGHAEYVWTIPKIKEFFSPYFMIHKIEKSFKHKHKDGRPWKRRTASVYLEKLG